MQKHIFDSKAFRAHRLHIMLLFMLPSFMIDAYLAVTFMNSRYLYENATIWNGAAPFFSNLVALKVPIFYYYHRVRTQRQESYVRTSDNYVVYRRNKRAAFAKTEYGYTYHDDFYFRNIQNVKRRKSGAIVAYGEISVLRKLPGIEAIDRQWKRTRSVIPPYYTDMDAIFQTLACMARGGGAA